MRLAPAVAIPLLVTLACSSGEKAAADSAAASPAVAAMSAALTDADVAGTWAGTAKAEGSDSVFVHWTQVCGSGACTGTAQEAPDTVRSTYRIDGDSVVGATGAYADPTMGGAKVIDNWVLRIAQGKLTGHGRYVLAEKPDSVVMRYTFEGARK